MEWLDQEWENPGIIPHYLMLVCSVISRCLTKSKSEPHHYKLKFGRAKPEGTKPQDMEVEEASRVSKARWGRVIGRKKQE